ncbi:unnamed protein product, partial [Symbiodinium sp. KB8]
PNFKSAASEISDNGLRALVALVGLCLVLCGRPCRRMGSRRVLAQPPQDGAVHGCYGIYHGTPAPLADDRKHAADNADGARTFSHCHRASFGLGVDFHIHCDQRYFGYPSCPQCAAGPCQ